MFRVGGLGFRVQGLGPGLGLEFGVKGRGLAV